MCCWPHAWLSTIKRYLFLIISATLKPMVTRPRAHWFPLSTFLCFTYLSLFYTPSPKFCFGDYQAAIPHPPGGRQGVLSRGKVPLYHFIKTPVEPPGRMTAAVEAPSIRAPDIPVTIHYGTAPCPGISGYHSLQHRPRAPVPPVTIHYIPTAWSARPAVAAVR